MKKIQMNFTIGSKAFENYSNTSDCEDMTEDEVIEYFEWLGEELDDE